MSTEHNMEFDNLHTLENFLDIYNNSGEMVVTEAIANSLDVDSDTIDIKIGKNSNGKRMITFQDNGPGMNKEVFADYHVGSRSTKSKGTGIGFAGIGAKVYLAAWDKTEIFTETCCGNEALSSVMYRDGRTLKWKELKPTHRQRGTLYKVLLSNEDYDYLEGSLEQIIIEFFNNALLNGLRITINGKVVKPWSPKTIKKKTGIITVKGRKLPYVFIFSGEEVPHERISIEYHVKGKKINTKKPEFYYDIKSEYQNNLYVSVDSISISDYLKTDKASFKPGFVSNVYRAVDKEILKIVEALGLIEKQTPQKYETNRFTKALEDLFNDPDFAWLNPDASAMRTISEPGPNNQPKSSSSTGTHDPNRQRNEGNRPSQRKGFSIMYGLWPKDERDGWLDLESNRPAVNLDHPLYRRNEKYLAARNYHVAKTVITTLVKNGATKKSLSVDEAFELQTKLLTKLRDFIW